MLESFISVLADSIQQGWSGGIASWSSDVSMWTVAIIICIALLIVFGGGK